MPSIEQGIEQASDLEQRIDDLKGVYSNWVKTDGRGNKQLWSLLSQVYELGSEIDSDFYAKRMLIQQVRKDPNVKAAKRWKPHMRKSHDLLLTVMLSLKEETKATKSQWLGAIRSAKKLGVEPNREAFFDWIKAAGGVKEARALNSQQGKPPVQLKELVAQLSHHLNEQRELIPVPKPFAPNPLPEGYALVLIKKDGSDGKAFPVGTIIDEKLVAQSVRRLVKDERRFPPDPPLDVKKLEDRILTEEDRRSALFFIHYELVETRNFTGSFEEFLADFNEDELANLSLSEIQGRYLPESADESW